MNAKAFFPGFPKRIILRPPNLRAAIEGELEEFKDKLMKKRVHLQKHVDTNDAAGAKIISH